MMHWFCRRFKVVISAVSATTMSSFLAANPQERSRRPWMTLSGVRLDPDRGSTGLLGGLNGILERGVMGLSAYKYT